MDCFTPMSQLLADAQSYVEGVLYPLLGECEDKKLWQRGLGDIANWPSTILDAEAKVFREELNPDIDALLAEIVAKPPHLEILIHKFITELSKTQAIKNREYFDRFGQQDRLAVIQSAMTRVFRAMKLKPTPSAKAPRTCPTMCSQAVVPTDSVSCVPRIDVQPTPSATAASPMLPASIPEEAAPLEVDMPTPSNAASSSKNPNNDIISFATIRSQRQEQQEVPSDLASSHSKHTMNISLVSRAPTLFSQRFPSLVPSPTAASSPPTTEDRKMVSAVSLART